MENKKFELNDAQLDDVSGGFSALSECVLDDRRIFTIFMSAFLPTAP